MAKTVPLITLLLIVVSSHVILCMLCSLVFSCTFLRNIPEDYSWIVHGLNNLLAYSTVLVPLYLTYKYIRNTNYWDQCGNGWTQRLLFDCFGDSELPTTSHSSAAPSVTAQLTFWHETMLLVFHFVGLQVSYLSWGILQEKVMTREYRSADGDTAHFKDSQFLVFVNRILAVLMSGTYLYFRALPRQKCPLYKYIYCSLSNVMSSWCQYEALLYVSFPYQVLAKAAKTIPVMIMGKIVSRTKYDFYEYVTNGILSFGMLLFMLDAENDRATSTVTTISGVILLCLYIAFDSFTSNWQGALFQTYNIKPIQMMCFVNFFSCILTVTSLIQQGTFAPSLNFMFKYDGFIRDCILLSICSATGQLFIFSTISHYGPVVFAIITTIRQCLSVLLSCLIYNHKLNVLGITGICLVFFSLALRIYCKQRLKKKRQNVTSKSTKTSLLK